MSDGPRDERWNEPGLASELSALLRAGREPLGTPKEVAELARRLSTLLGPEAGLTDGGQQGAADAEALPQPAGEIAGPSQNLPGPGAAGTSTLGAASRSLWALGGMGAGVAIAIAAFIALSGRSAPVDAPHPPLSPPAVAVPLAAPAEPASTAPPVASSAEPEPSPSSDGALERGAAVEPPRPPRASNRRALAQTGASPRARRDDTTETALLEQARAALQSRPVEALELTRRHQARFPRGALVQEREIIAIEALERLGRRGPASARAAEFERRYRGSVHRSRLLREQENPRPAPALSR